MYKLISLFITGSLLLTTSTFAKPNLPPPIQDVVKLEKMAGEPGPFTPKDNFPKDYFLMSKNLPYLVGLALYHPASSNLELSQKQIDALIEIKKTVTPKVAKAGLEVKKLELEVVYAIAIKHNDVKAASLYEKIDKIAKLQAELTKSHLRCIEKVKSILTDEQYEELMDYGVVNMF